MELREIRMSVQLDKPIYSFQEFCKLACLSQDYVRKLHSQGRIPFSRPFGRKLYITKEDALEVLRQNASDGVTSIERHAKDYFLNSKMK
jgi:excisionase family DNA binding protein